MLRGCVEPTPAAPGRARPALTSVGEDESGRHPMAVAVLAAEEQRRGALVLDRQEPVIAPQPDVACREPLETASGVPGQIRLVVVDAKDIDASARAQREAADATGQIRHQRAIAAAWIEDDVAAVGPHAGCSLIGQRLPIEGHALMNADGAAELSLDADEAVDVHRERCV